jgi:hypothetical protein
VGRDEGRPVGSRAIRQQQGGLDLAIGEEEDVVGIGQPAAGGEAGAELGEDPARGSMSLTR